MTIGAPLVAEWTLASSAPGELCDPTALEAARLDWRPAVVPGTAAQALAAAGEWDFDHPRDFDASDWWYRGSFAHDAADRGVTHHLIFEGLATLAEVWLNGVPIARSDSMFRVCEVDVTALLQSRNDLVIVFRSLGAALATRRLRPRWRTRLVDQQNLRWFRTTLLGRMPGWSPPVAPVGPYRAIRLACGTPGDVRSCDLRATLEGTTGRVDLDAVIVSAGGAAIAGELAVGDWRRPVHTQTDAAGTRLTVHATFEDVAPWWPHTHGSPVLYPCVLRYTVDGRSYQIDCGRIGFRHVELRRDGGGFVVAVNGTPIFCRGACWTTSDIVSLAGSDADLARELTIVRDAGANMLRVGGTMIYERDEFYRRCDALGLLVWQDFMFANMDYPVADATFRASIEGEVAEQVRRLDRHPSVAVYCGNSEVEQQAAMMGVDRAHWSNEFFQTTIPSLLGDRPYVPSTPTGGDLPFQVGKGIGHYYGVGAYRRSFEDVRRANVRFSPECLAFANVPDADLVAEISRDSPPVTHDARWKQRTPRDGGAGWDFEDVRDHYVNALFSVDPASLRSVDSTRYLDLGRVTTGEAMSRVFSEWRRPGSTCSGGLVWFLKDLWPGAGWGLLDSRGVPKACLHALGRVWQPRALLVTDEGLDGLHAHVVNDLDEPLSATLTVTLLRGGSVVTACASRRCDVGPRASATLSAEAVLGGFHDVTHAYRFGPPGHDVVAFVLQDAAGQVIREAFWLRDAAETARECSGAAIVDVGSTGPATYNIAITSERFLFAAHVDAPGFLVDDNWFCVMPGQTKVVRVRPFDPGARRPLRGFLEALNLDGPVALSVRSEAGVRAS